MFLTLINTIIITILLLIFTLILKDLIFEDRIKKINKSIPGPKGVPVFGNLLQINANDPATSINDMYNKYGPVYRLRLGNVETVILTGSSVLDQAFNKKFREQFKERYVKLSRLVGRDKNLLNSNGDIHYKLRGELMSEITVRKLNNDRIQANKFILKLLDDLYINDQTIVENIPLNLKKLAIKIIINFVFGVEEDNETTLTLISKVTSIFKSAGLFIYSDYLPILFPLDILSMVKSNIVSSYFYIKDYTNSNIKRLDDKYKNLDINDADDDTSFKPLVEKYYKKYLNGEIPYDTIMFTSVDIIIAAVDTTSNTMGFIIARLINDQDMQDKLYNEVKDAPDDISFADHSKYPFVITIMNESYRYYALVSITEPNMTTEDVEIQVDDNTSYKIAKGTQVIKNLRGTLLSSEYWGDDSNEFKPDRFQTQTLNQKGLFHFGAGPRGCPGGRFTECLFFTTLVLLFKHYKLVNPTDVPIDDQGDVGLAMQCKKYNAIFVKRSNN